MRLQAYTRVSRVAGRENLISPELQQARIQSFANMRGWTVTMLPPELDVSGGKVKRPILERAIQDVEAGRTDGIIVSQIDRLSRMRMTEALTVIERIEAAGGQVIAVGENVDPTTPEGRMARNVFLSFAAMQRERNAQAIAEAKERAVRHGIWPMSKIPPGYRKGKHRRLVFGSDAPKVRAAFRARAAGRSWREVGQILGDDLGPSTAAKVIRNRVYLGEITVGEWHNPAAHKPLIDRTLFEAAQFKMPAPTFKGDGTWLLRGLVRCGGCQRTMSVSEGAYRCLGRARCELRARVRHDVLDDLAVNLILTYVGGATQEPQQPNDGVAHLEAAEAELSAFQQASQAAGDIDLFTEGLKQRANAVRDARTRLTATRHELPRINLAEEWPDLNLDQRRHLLSGLLGVVWVWDRNNIRFVARGFEPDGLSRPGRKGPEPIPLLNTALEGEIRVPLPGNIK